MITKENLKLSLQNKIDEYKIALEQEKIINELKNSLKQEIINAMKEMGENQIIDLANNEYLDLKEYTTTRKEINLQWVQSNLNQEQLANLYTTKETTATKLAFLQMKIEK